MRRIARTFAVLVAAAGLLVTLSHCSTRSFDNPSREIGTLVSGFVQNDKSVKNCVLFVTKGDGSFTCSVAAGIAHEDSQAPMTKDTPFFIASVTKLYTATAIMRLQEQGRLSLDDPMSRYLPEGVVHGIHIYKGKDYSHEITIKHLLSHTSGIADYYDEKPKGGRSLFEVFVEEPERSWTVGRDYRKGPEGPAAQFPARRRHLLFRYQLSATGLLGNRMS
jgi:CubicO group peptidase (beta-lactamase class C family)